MRDKRIRAKKRSNSYATRKVFRYRNVSISLLSVLYRLFSSSSSSVFEQLVGEMYPLNTKDTLLLEYISRVLSLRGNGRIAARVREISKRRDERDGG